MYIPLLWVLKVKFNVGKVFSNVYLFVRWLVCKKKKKLSCEHSNTVLVAQRQCNSQTVAACESPSRPSTDHLQHGAQV